MFNVFIKTIVWLWTIVVGGTGLLLAMFAGRDGAGPGVIVLLVGLVPLALMIWAGQKRRAGWGEVHARMLAEAGVPAGGGYEHGEEDSDIAVNRQARTVTLLHAGRWKTYPFSDVRAWKGYKVRPGQAVAVGGNLSSHVAAMGAEARAKQEAAADTGLFVEVRDIEHPKWRAAMKEERAQLRWIELLRQEINEGAGANAGAGHAHA